MAAGQIAGIVFFSIAFLINIFAVATPAWIYDRDLSTSSGLFQIVSDSASVSINRDEAENSALAFSIIADILLICAIAAAAVGYAKKSTGLIGRLGGIIGLVAALFIVTGMSIYTGLRVSGIDFELFLWGYSFALGWVSFCLAFIGGISAVMDC